MSRLSVIIQIIHCNTRCVPVVNKVGVHLPMDIACKEVPLRVGKWLSALQGEGKSRFLPICEPHQNILLSILTMKVTSTGRFIGTIRSALSKLVRKHPEFVENGQDRVVLRPLEPLAIGLAMGLATGS